MRYLGLLIVFITSISYSQTVLLLHDVNEDKDSESGPGKTTHAGGSFYYGLIAGPAESDSVPLKLGKSFELGYGSYAKWQPNKFFGLGVENNFMFRIYSFKQNNEQLFRDPSDNKRESLWFISYQINPFMRLSYTLKRGDHHGMYTDFGMQCNYSFINRYTQVNKATSTSGNTRITESRLDYVKRLTFEPTFRLGIRNIIFYAKYRLNDIFKTVDGYKYPELTRFTFGIAIMS